MASTAQLAGGASATTQATSLLVANKKVAFSAGHWDPNDLHMHGNVVRVKKEEGVQALPLDQGAHGASAGVTLADVVTLGATLFPLARKANRRGRLRCECGAGEAQCSVDLREGGQRVGK